LTFKICDATRQKPVVRCLDPSFFGCFNSIANVGLQFAPQFQTDSSQFVHRRIVKYFGETRLECHVGVFAI